MITKLEGLVIRTVNYGESDRILTVLTAQSGLVTVTCKGANGVKSRLHYCSHILFYGEFTCYIRHDRLWASEAAPLRDFYDVDMGLYEFCLCQYILEVLCAVCVEQTDESDMLRLALNTLHMLSKKNKPLWLVKAVFEMRCACELGFMPDLGECCFCSQNREDGYFLDIAGGCIICASCSEQYMENSVQNGVVYKFAPLDAAVRQALSYLCTAPPDRIFAFGLDEALSAQFSQICETYLLYHIDRGFKTLDYYKKLLET